MATHISRYDFEMVYTREEGIKGPYLCGNGSRCIVAFAHYLKVPCKAEKYSFWARDGPHIGWVDDITGQVHVKFRDMDKVTRYDDDNFYIHVGNERHVAFVKNLWEIDVIEKGRLLGYQDRYMDEGKGCNVMFVQVEPDGNLSARSFEAKIDYEPLACGTGAVASVLVDGFRKGWQGLKKEVKVGVTYKGGKVEIMFDHVEPTRFENVYLIGPAIKTYEGSIRYEDFLALPDYKYNYNK